MIIRAPFTKKQVSKLLKRQNDEALHPYTCAEHSDNPMMPTENGFRCMLCDYTQDWCHDFDANGIDETILVGSARVIYDEIDSFWKENHYGPSIRELKERCDIASTSSVVYYLTQLRNEGFILYNDKIARSIRTAEIDSRMGEALNTEILICEQMKVSA